MAAIAAGIFNHASGAAQALKNTSPTPMSSPSTGSTGTSSTSSSSATISANDFLTLLVTEMKNQDPTANTDPNEYINQLVNVNSLEQLIDINQNLSTALGNSSTSSGSPGTGQGAQPKFVPAAADIAGADAQANAAAQMGSAHAAAQPAISIPGAAGNLAAMTSAAKRVSGNLSIPNSQPAAEDVAHALDGRSRAQSIASGILNAK